MAIYKEDIVDIELESGTIHRSFLCHAIGLGDNQGNRFGVRLFRNGAAENVGSASVTGLFMAPNGTNYIISGSGNVWASGNVAGVILPSGCYAVEGQFTLAIKLSLSGVVTTMRIIDGVVSNTGTTGAVVPSSNVPTSDQIIAAYQQAVAVIDSSVRYDVDQSLTAAQKTQARTNIEAAGLAQVVRVDADQELTSTQKGKARTNINATDLAQIAPAFNEASAYNAGQYVTYNGVLYRLTADHAANTTWANTSKSAVTVDGQLRYVLSQIAPVFNASTAYKAGQYVTYNGALYKIIADHAAGYDWANTNKTAVTMESRIRDALLQIAPVFNDSTAYAAGSYVTYNGELYLLPNGSDAGDVWAGIPKTKTNIGSQITDLKSAISETTLNLWDEQILSHKYLDNNGAVATSSTPAYCSANYIEVSPSTVYYFCSQDNTNARIAQYDSNKTFISFLGYFKNATFTTGATTKYIRFWKGGSDTYDVGSGVAIYLNSTGQTEYIHHLTAYDLKARQGVNNVNTKIDNMYQLTGNMWDEQILSHKYLDNNGAVTTPSSPAYCSADFIEVSSSTSYYFCSEDNNNARIAQYDSSKAFISYLGYFSNAIFTTGATTKYIKFWKGGSDTYNSGSGIAIYPASSSIRYYLPYKTLVDAVARADANQNDYIIVGSGQTYTTVVAGFAAAIAQDKGCIILPGVYNLVSEGASSGTGIIAPKHVIGYGAKLIASLSSENWTYSAVNISPSMDEVIIEGLEIEVTNCRYCVHDEMENRAGFYHHVFKNCKMKHNSVESATLIRPVCIGGGFGNSGLVEIERCNFSSQSTALQDVNYHARTGGQTGYCEVKCVDSVFRQTIGITGNASTGFVNVMYVCGCLGGSLPIGPNPVHTNSKLVQWNNAVTD